MPAEYDNYQIAVLARGGVEPVTNQVAPSIIRLFERARTVGKPDSYTGKRDNERYRARVPLEITRDPNSEDRLTGELHDVSLSGAGFIAHEEVKANQPLFIRAWDPRQPDEWIAVDVVHVTKALSGFLIGARFPDPSATGPDDDAVITDLNQLGVVLNPAAVARLPEGPPTPTPTRFSRVSLRGKCAMIAGLTGMMGSVAGVLLALSPFWTNATFLIIGVFACGCAALSALLMWLFLGDEERFLRKLNRRLTGQPAGRNDAGEIRAPSSIDFQGLDAVLHDLHNQINKHNDAVGRQQQRISELDEIEGNILNVVAHDLRTPLTSIVLHAELMRTEMERLSVQDQQHCLHVIGVETGRLTRLVENLMHAQRAADRALETHVKNVDLREVVEQSLRDYRALADQKAVTLEFEGSHADSFVTDANLLSQIVSNLVANAIHYAPRGGCVCVSTEIHGDELTLSVSDNGPGIARQYWDQIFGRFIQVRTSLTNESPGVGIGLYVVKEMVSALGGRVWLDSVVGKGAEFFVSLPKFDEQRPRTAGAGKGEKLGRVLLCDTDAELVSRIAQVLENEGWRVATAYCGQRLIQRVTSEQFDVVVADVAMHDAGSDELIPVLTDPQRSFRIVAHTHCDFPESLLEYGFDAVVARPAARADLLRAITAAQRSSGGRFSPMLFVARKDDPLHEVGSAFAAECKLPIIATTVADARSALGQLQVERILVSERILDADWSALTALATDDRSRQMIVVVCEEITTTSRERARQHSVGIAKLDAVLELSAVLRARE